VVDTERLQLKLLELTCDNCGKLQEKFCIMKYNEQKLICCEECYHSLPTPIKDLVDFIDPEWVIMSGEAKDMIERMTN